MKTMTNEEYEATQAMLLQAARMLDILDLDAFRDRIRTADAVGAVLDPTLYREGHRRLHAIDEVAEAGIRVKAAFMRLRSQVRSELVAVAEEA